MTIRNITIPNFLSSSNQKIYEEVTNSIRRSLSRGSTYEEACDNIQNVELDLKRYIMEDFLKILIAEEYFGTGVDLDDIALFLGLSYDEIETGLESLLMDISREVNHHNMSHSNLVH